MSVDNWLEATVPATPVLTRGHSAYDQPSLAYLTPIPVQLTGYTSHGITGRERGASSVCMSQEYQQLPEKYRALL